MVNIFTGKTEILKLIGLLVDKGNIWDYIYWPNLNPNETNKLSLKDDEYIYFGERKLVYEYKNFVFSGRIAKGLTDLVFESLPARNKKERYLLRINEDDQTFKLFYSEVK